MERGTIHVRIDDHIKEELSKLAEKHGFESMSLLVRRILKDWVVSERKKENEAQVLPEGST